MNDFGYSEKEKSVSLTLVYGRNLEALERGADPWQSDYVDDISQAHNARGCLPRQKMPTKLKSFGTKNESSKALGRSFLSSECESFIKITFPVKRSCKVYSYRD